ncbi:hypothetical protein AYO21_11217 [Fonsecaea monophora]|uniref:Uncharacterized protein n=1 Tax=Fonsecaea monophora TaxID=254056 RepID=A0A177ET62_9EURO|nr:hypothetical protein AYO21_11217 [Fonsecaea monophora]OAG34621.1 hypothetical protein AYO21_11217 [Fonsecaea monophora]
MNQTTAKDDPGAFASETKLSPSSPDAGSEGSARHIETQDEWPSSRDFAQRYGRYDTQGFLVDFEHTTAYMLPRKAPVPPRPSTPISPSGLTSTTLIDQSSSQSEPLIAIPYESTSEADSQPHTRPQIRFSDTYRKWWLQQYSRPEPLVRLASRTLAQGSRQGFWLARGTLRGCDEVMMQQGPGYWLARATMKDAQQDGGAGSADIPSRFWGRVVDKVRRISGEEK